MHQPALIQTQKSPKMAKNHQKSAFSTKKLHFDSKNSKFHKNPFCSVKEEVFC